MRVFDSAGNAGSPARNLATYRRRFMDEENVGLLARFPANGSGNEIEWIWQFEYTPSVAAPEIAVLVSDVDDDRYNQLCSIETEGRAG